MACSSWWLEPQKPMTVLQAYNRHVLDTSKIRLEQRGAPADYGGQRYGVSWCAHRCYWYAGYKRSFLDHWSAIRVGSFEEALLEALYACRRDEAGAQVRVDVPNVVMGRAEVVRIIGQEGLARFDEAAQVAYEAKLPWQNRTYKDGPTRRPYVVWAVKAVQRGVPLDLWLTAESPKDWFAKLADHKASSPAGLPLLSSPVGVSLVG